MGQLQSREPTERAHRSSAIVVRMANERLFRLLDSHNDPWSSRDCCWTGVLFIPEMASTLLLLPFAIVISTLCLAVYGTIDSAIVLTTTFMIPRKQSGRLVLRMQGICGAVIGILLCVVAYDRIDLHWFLYLAAVQAAGTAVAEFTVARGTTAHHGSNWCYASAIVAAISSIALLFGRNLSPRELAWLIYG